MPEQLTDLPKVDEQTAESLREIGFTSFQSLAVAAASELASDTQLSEDEAQDIIATARENAEIGGFDAGNSVLERQKEPEHLKTGLLALDDLLGGGIETQSLVHVFGSENSGRGELMHQLAVRAHLPPSVGGLGGRAVFIDTRDSFDPGLIRTLVEGLEPKERAATAEYYGVEETVDAITDLLLDQLLYASPGSVGEQMLLVDELDKRVSAFQDTKAPIRLIVLDSLIANFNAEFPPGDRGKLADRRQKLNKHLHDLDKVTRESNAASVYTNSLTSGGDPYDGNLVTFKAPYNLRLTKTSGEKRHLELDGIHASSAGTVDFYIDEHGLTTEKPSK